MAPFRIQAKHILLTYPRCDLSKQELYAFVTALRTVDKVLVAKEYHQDGTPHLHAYVGFDSKPNIRNERHFDYQGFHPNIKACPKAASIKYITKSDKEPLGNFEWHKKKAVEEAHDKIIELIEEGKSNQDIFAEAIRTDKSLLRCAASVTHFINRLHVPKVGSTPKFLLESFSLAGIDKARLELWSNSVNCMERGDRRAAKSLWFTGPSMTGKTSLARSLGNHWYMQNAWNIDKITDQPNYYGVLDDIDWDHLSRFYKCLIGRQLEVELTDKYRHKKTFQMGYPIILCSNDLPEFTNQQKEWLRINCDFYEIACSILPCNPIIPFIKVNI